MAFTFPAEQRARNARAKQASDELRAHVIGEIKACCLPWLVEIPDAAHRPDMCMKCRDRAHFLRARTW